MKRTILILMLCAAVGITVSCSSSGGGSISDIAEIIEETLQQGANNPVAVLEVDIATGEAPLEVLFTGSASYDPEGGSLSFTWDFGDESGSILSDPPLHVYDVAGSYTVTLIVEKSGNLSDVATVTIEVLEPEDSGVFVDEEEGVVAGMTLDENIDEDSPAELFGDVQWVPGISGSGMEFNEGGEYILLPDATELDLLNQGTVEVWIYPYTNIAAAGIVHKGVEADFSDESFSLQYNQAGQVAFVLTNDSNKNSWVMSNEGLLSTNEWHHIVAAWDLNDVYLYIDGSLVTDIKYYDSTVGWVTELPADFAPAKNSDGGLMVGSQPPYQSAWDLRFDGIIDNVLIYDRVLLITEVEDHYTSLAP
jgi:PKD repeat protein